MNIGDIPVNVIGATRTELTIQIPANAPANSRVSIKGSNMELPIELHIWILVFLSYLILIIGQVKEHLLIPANFLMLLLIFCVTEH